MKITLKNFGIHTSRTFEFPEKGCLLLSGISGKGKTTLFRALHFAITGESKMVTHGETKSMVILEYRQNKITRTNRPVRVVLEREGKSYEDEAAQAEINRIFPSFSAAGYILQKGVNSFLAMTPMEKLRFLEEIIFSGISLDEQKEKIKTLISQNEQLFYQKKGELETYQKNFPPVPTTTLSLQKLQQDSQEIPLQQSKLKEELNVCQKQYQDVLQIEQEIAHLEKELTAIHFDQVPESVESYAPLLLLWQQYHTFLNEQDSIRQLEQYCTQVLAGLEQVREKMKVLNYQEEKKKVCQLEIKATQQKILQYTSLQEYRVLKQKYQPEKEKEIAQLIKEKETFLLSYRMGKELKKCPACFKSLRWHQNNLHLAEDSKEEYSLVTEQKYLAELDQYKRELAQISRDNANFLSFANKSIEDSNITSEELQQTLLTEKQKLLSLQQDEKQHIKLEQEWQQLLSSEKVFLEAEKKLLPLQQQIEEKKSKLINLTPPEISQIECQKREQDYLTREKLREKIRTETIIKQNQQLTLEKRKKDLELKLLSAEGRLQTSSELKQTLILLQQQQEELQKRNLTLQREIMEYNSYIRDCQKYNAEAERLNQCLQQYHQAEKDFTKSKQFRDLFLTAEMNTLSSYIEELNALLQNYLNIFFESPLTIEISLFKINEKNKTVKNQVNLIVGYQGHTIDLDSLSGGEQDRVNLAFTLALADLFELPLVMLDETLSSLDAQSAENVIEHLPKDRLTLLIAHQVTEGHFDLVIKI